ncbi:MAG: hypothetical protein OXU41_09780 [Gammaproteobacteria bacterium]|nr:hypothetical protein [Gammaproteobacteria bacterium]MDD9871789.1 hypothetical protein [Gammaproteobacteria bacterium]
MSRVFWNFFKFFSSAIFAAKVTISAGQTTILVTATTTSAFATTIVKLQTVVFTSAATTPALGTIILGLTPTGGMGSFRPATRF